MLGCDDDFLILLRQETLWCLFDFFKYLWSSIRINGREFSGYDCPVRQCMKHQTIFPVDSSFEDFRRISHGEHEPFGPRDEQKD
jgi:hypothetical protein